MLQRLLRQRPIATHYSFGFILSLAYQLERCKLLATVRLQRAREYEYVFIMDAFGKY